MGVVVAVASVPVAGGVPVPAGVSDPAGAEVGVAGRLVAVATGVGVAGYGGCVSSLMSASRPCKSTIWIGPLSRLV